MENLCKIREIYRLIADLEAQLIKQYDLSLNEGILLCALTQTTELTSGEIAETLGLTNSNASKIIRSIEQKKYITRLIGKEDKRQMQFSLTEEGKRKIEMIQADPHELPPLLQKIIQIL